MKPTEALDIQAYFKGKCKDVRWQDLLQQYVEITVGRKHLYNETEWKNSLYKEALEIYKKDILDVGQNGECFFVKEEMTDLIQFASQKLDETDVMDLSLVPADKGFAYFEKPLPIQDVRGRQMLINLVLWKKVFGNNGKMALSVSFWNDSQRTPDDLAKTIIEKTDDATRLLGRFHWISAKSIHQHQEIGEAEIVLDDEHLETVRKITFKKGGQELLSPEEWEEYKATQIKPITNTNRLLWSYFLIMSQTLTEVSKHQAENRTQRKRIEREGLPSEFVVVQFRKRRYVNADTDETHEENAVEWSHRWIVGGHWRWQPYKDPVSKGVIKKRIWISPYVKGPEDKPLIAKSKVFVLAK